MTGLPFIIDLFTGILAQSKAIKGNFHIGFRYGLQEINMDQLGEVMKEVNPTNKYPLSIITPPHSQLRFTDEMGEWERYRIIQFFMVKSYTNADLTIKDENLKTGTSKHSIHFDWHDMKRCAVNFGRALCILQRSIKPARFRMPPNQVLFAAISQVGADNASGIKMSYDLDVWLGCTKEDYDEYPTNLIISDDSHPEHKL